MQPIKFIGRDGIEREAPAEQVLGWIIGMLCGIFAFVCFIMGIVNVCNGQMKELPAIGKISILSQN